MTSLAPAAILFDLDGTLVDTAPDMAGALNDMRAHRALPPLPYADLRALVSHGSRALVQRGFAPHTENTMATLIAEFLDTYAQRVARDSRIFAGLDLLLDALDASRVPWGVVTNKPVALSQALLEQLGLATRCGVLLGGDSLVQRKPHPMPLLHAASELGVVANQCLYIGDAQRDITAGRCAGMTTVAAAFGYLLPDDDITAWGADYVVHTTADLVALVDGCLTHRAMRQRHANH